MIEATKIHHRLFTPRTVNAHHRLHPAYSRQGARLIEMIAGNVQMAVVLRLDPLKAIEGMLAPCNRPGDLQGTPFYTAPMRRYNGEWGSAQAQVHTIIAALDLRPAERTVVRILIHQRFKPGCAERSSLTL